MLEGRKLSITLICGLYVPVAVGVPEITPAVDIVKPGGKEPPNRNQLYDGLPPVAAIVVEYAVPVVPDGRVRGVVIESGA